MVAFFVSRILADDNEEIERAVQALQQPMTDIKHIEYLNNNEAIAFYEWGQEPEHFGHGMFEKRLLGWEFYGGSTYWVDSEMDFGLTFSNLEFSSSTHTDLISGIIGHPDIVMVEVETLSGNTYDAEIIEYDAGERFWFLLTDGDNTVGSIVTGLTEDSEVITQEGI
ncbi:hypothetical protein GCM10008932_10040 [Alkalibacterium iburiense]|uniref:DUF4309 domain-containing protein n=1 Tax=Alkalibacterium iburiense TaxID=290589 RepID=A0ABP3H2Y1_9LACT